MIAGLLNVHAELMRSVFMGQSDMTALPDGLQQVSIQCL